MFHDASNAKENIQLVSFQPFQDTADAVAAITACQEGKVSSSLQQFLTKRIKKLLKKSSSDYNTLAIADKTLASNIKQDILSTADTSKKMKVVNDDKTAEIFRGIRCYMDYLLGDGTDGGNDETNASGTGLSSSDMHKMQLGLSHSLGRYKLKFSADKVDTMIIQAVGLLDELDKESKFSGL
jgi:nucleolar protein 58